uniref:RxLR effector candidate protein n=2 Tax=Hyaloperonospora arabidopsidis (strain Emoy2) TaxID=559515 RepID=M4C4B3_HYAAE
MSKWIKFLTLVAAIEVTSRSFAQNESKLTGLRRTDDEPLTPSQATRALLSFSFDDDDSNDSDSSDSDDVDDDDKTHSQVSTVDVLPTVEFPPNVKIGSTANTVDKIVPTFPNWVGPTIGKSSDPAFDKACWRKTHIMKTCPYGFDRHMKICWAQCPLAFPVRCGFECIRQSDDCGAEIYAKFVSGANAFFSVQIMNAFGEFSKLSKLTRVGIKCARAMLGTMRAMVNYMRAYKVSNPEMPREHIVLALYQTSYVTIDLPVSTVMCMGRSYNWQVLDPLSVVMGSVQVLVGEILARHDSIMRSWGKFRAFLLRANFTYAVNDLNETEISSLKTGMKSKSMCGYELQRLTDRTWRTIAEMKEADPKISKDDLRVAVYKSDLMLNDIPTVTNNCMDQMIMESDEKTAYQTRDTLRKTYSVIVDDLIDKGKSDNGTSLSAKKYARVVADKVFMAIATVFYIDLTRISGFMSEYIQTICGPTQVIGEIDDGTDPKTLGFRTVGDAFENSTMSWKRKGDGIVRINFFSTDTKDVTVNMISASVMYDKKFVPAGKTVSWTTTVEQLGGKTLYLDRWRPGFLGLPGTGGGSLNLWVPRAKEGGHLELNVMVNVS